MIFKLSDSEFEALKKRVADGKIYLDGRWNEQLTNPEIARLVRLWMQLADQLLEQEGLRGMFPRIPTHEEVMASAEKTLERVKQQMIERGLLKAVKKKGGSKKDVSSKSTKDNSLFSTSQTLFG